MLINVFGGMPYFLFIEQDTMQIQLDCLSLVYGKGALTPAQAAALLDDSRGTRTPEDFARRLEPYLAQMGTKEEARRSLATLINKRRQALTDLMPAAQAWEDQAIAQEVALAKCDISDAGFRREQYQSMADGLRHRALRDFHALQAVRRKFGTGTSEEAPHEEDRDDADGNAVADSQAAPPEGAAPAGAVPNQNEPTVTQPAGEPKGCGAEAVQSDHPGGSQPNSRPVRSSAMPADCVRRSAEEERLE
jgi:hypothetical protein